MLEDFKLFCDIVRLSKIKCRLSTGGGIVSGDSEFYNKVAFRGHRVRGADVIPGGEPLKAQITLSL